MISSRFYVVTDPDGHEHDVRWLRLGSRRVFIEAGKWGVYVRLGDLILISMYNRSPEDE